MSAPSKPLYLRFLQDPLFHFCIAGAVIFLVARYYGTPEDTSQRHIVIGASEVARLEQAYQAFHGRAPGPEELQKQVEALALEEILVREALARGLDENDPLIRKRLQEKMEFVLEAAESLPEPSDEELQTFLTERADYYAVPPQLSLKHVFVSEAERGPTAEEDARSFLRELETQGPAASVTGLGDQVPFPSEFERATVARLRWLFGRAIVDQMMELPLNQWQGPLRSDFGLHLVLVSERFESRTADLEEVRANLRHEWQTEQRLQLRERALQELRTRYTVTVAPAEVTTPANTAAEEPGEETP